MNYPPQNAQPQPPPVKKNGSGCLLVVGIAAAIVGLIAVVGAFLVYRAAKSPEGQAIVQSAGVMMDAAKAPGAAELRTLGCAQALVIDAERLTAANERWIDGGPRSDALRDMKRSIVCQVDKRSPPLTCESVAVAYRTAVGAPPGAFSVTVVAVSRAKQCAALFDAAGTKLKDLAL